MVRLFLPGFLLMMGCCAVPLSTVAQEDFVPPRRPVATYSIVARDSLTGQLGVAVQSHWFSVGSLVPWAEAGVGAVATQSFVDPTYGPLGLELMRLGRGAEAALAALTGTDPGREVRQVAMVDASGQAAAHTGSSCIREAGHHTGAQYSVQANLMENGTVWDAMATAYENAEGDLADRLLAALAAAEGEGGDIRGRQSAAILVVSGEPTGISWRDRLFDLRVEDNPDPVKELVRLVKLQRAYLKLNEGDELWSEGLVEDALAAYSEAGTAVSDAATNGEAAFWIGITLASSGETGQALPFLRRAFVQDPRWAELVGRLPAAGLLPADEALIRTLVAGMRKGTP